MKKNGHDVEPAPSSPESSAAEGGERDRERGAKGTEEKPAAELSAETVAQVLKSIEKDRSTLAPFLDAPRKYGELLDEESDVSKKAFLSWAETVEEKWRACYAQLLKAADASEGDSRFRYFREDIAHVKQNLAENWPWNSGDLMRIRDAGRHYDDDTPFIGRLSGKRGKAVARLVDSPEVKAYSDARWNELHPRFCEIGGEFLDRARALKAELNEADVFSRSWDLETTRELVGGKGQAPPEIKAALEGLRMEIGKIISCMEFRSEEKGEFVFSDLKDRKGAILRLQDLQHTIYALEDRWSGRKKLSPEEARAEVERIRKTFQEHNEKALKGWSE